MRIRENGILTGNMDQRKLAKNVKQDPSRFFAYLKNKKKSNKIVPFLNMHMRGYHTPTIYHCTTFLQEINFILLLSS